MDRELLLEIGCEELPASWLPGLTNQIGRVVEEQLRTRRLPPEAATESYSTPRRLTVRISRVPERQTDLEELVTGPPVSAAFKSDGTATPAAAGFAAKQGVDVGQLKTASQGYFSVGPRDGEDCDDCNSSGGSTPFQKVRVVTTIDYNLG